MGIGTNRNSSFCRKGLTLVEPEVGIPDFGRFRARNFGSLLALNLPHSVAHATVPGSRTHGLDGLLYLWMGYLSLVVYLKRVTKVVFNRASITLAAR